MSLDARPRPHSGCALALTLLCAAAAAGPVRAAAAGSYESLVALFQEWRTFERPALRDGAPDYTAPKRWRLRSSSCP
ncbi:MAG TPA: hypothetical protein VGG06_30400 [Thermoanaerobaculia bacterium]|jgi:hypothetical protein